MRRRITINRGSYTVEGAFTVVIFTALIMMLLSIITVIETETEIQSALNQTAMQLSQYSYAIGSELETEHSETALLKSILYDAKREAAGFAAGSALCSLLTKDRIDEKTLHYVDGGYGGLDFSASNVLGDGKTVHVAVIYTIHVPVFGLIEKKLRICQKAQTAAWLPYDAEKSMVSEDASTPQEQESSIWNETNFARGRYFVKQEKEKYPASGVRSGQGIDLYDKEKGRASEVFSMNVFSPTYSAVYGDLSDPLSYSPNREEMEKQILTYVRALKKDVRECGRTIIMDSGAEERFELKTAEIIVVVPEEAKNHAGFAAAFEEIKNAVLKKDGMELTIIYSEEAL